MAVVVICAVILLMQWISRRQAILANEALSAEVNEIVEEPVEEPEEEIIEEPKEEEYEYPVPDKNLDWDEIRGINEDIYAWIYVPGYEVDYPVLQDPDDDGYYLNHNLDGSIGYPGCIYTEATYNSKDFSDNNTVIYGHNLKDKTMFSHLHDLEDEDLGEEHLIYVYTQDASYVYRIYAVYDYPAVHLLANGDMTDTSNFSKYLDSVKNAKPGDRVRNVDTDNYPTADDKILTLSTCTSDHLAELRFITQGVLIETVEN